MNEVLRRPARRSHATIKEVAELRRVADDRVAVLNRRETVKERPGSRSRKPSAN